LLEYDDDLPVRAVSRFLSALSRTVVAVADEISRDDRYLVRRRVTIYNGRIVDISIWQFFLQHTTHQTHHQGQLSLWRLDV
jgi:uncharacterized damage-inducible protein DinB